MGLWNQPDWNDDLWNGPGPEPGSDPSIIPPAAPVATISSPLAPPPQQFTNIATLINGQYKEAGVLVYRNGVLLTQGFDYTRDGGIVTLIVAPGPGDIMSARVFAIGKALGGPYPERYIAPWTLRLTGAFDNAGLLYSIVFPPTITGGCDGRNNLFGWGCVLQRAQIFRNGLLQTINVDVVNGGLACVFLPGSIPQVGDLITVLGY